MPNEVIEEKASADQTFIESKRSHGSDLEAFTPFVPLSVTLRELTPLALVFGIGVGLVLGTASLYLVLKVGFTITSSIAIAVTSITLFRILSRLGLRNPSILEHNIAQSAGSATDAIAFAMALIVPAMLSLGFDLSVWYVILMALIGGLLGILLMIPLRRQFIVQMHGRLKYPEAIATAKIAETLVDKGGKMVLLGSGVSFLYYVSMNVFRSWKEIASWQLGKPFEKAAVSIEVSPVLVGAGYIIGPRVASTMCAGGVMAYLILNPLIAFFGQGSAEVIAPATVPIAMLRPDGLRREYIFYIGAGAIVTAGLFSLFRSLPAIWHGLKGGLADLRVDPLAQVWRHRNDRDIPMKVVACAILGVLLLATIVLRPPGFLSILGLIMIGVLGFVYVSVSAQLTGEVGTSSNPLSGLTLGALLLTCLVFLVVGWTSRTYQLAALTIGAIIGICASTGGTTSQILKTGFLLGATPKSQQIAILLGALASAIVLGPLLIWFNETSTVYVPHTTFAAVSSESDSLRAHVPISSLPAYTDGIRPPLDGSYWVTEIGHEAADAKRVESGTYLVNETGRIVYKLERNFPADLRADVAQLGPEQKLKGVQGVTDTNTYRLWQKPNPIDGPPGRYLVDREGTAVYLIDPGINGSHNYRPDGTRVEKFEAPRASLFAYIVAGTLRQELPWGLFLMGVMLVIVLELCGVDSLVFAVGLYLPLSVSTPLLVGGAIRKLVDVRHSRKKHESEPRGDEESPGVLMASGYIAGGALAAILISSVAALFRPFNNYVEHWAEMSNPFFSGRNADLLSLTPLVVVSLLLYLVASRVLLSDKDEGTA